MRKTHCIVMGIAATIAGGIIGACGENSIDWPDKRVSDTFERGADSLTITLLPGSGGKKSFELSIARSGTVEQGVFDAMSVSDREENVGAEGERLRALLSGLDPLFLEQIRGTISTRKTSNDEERTLHLLEKAVFEALLAGTTGQPVDIFDCGPYAACWWGCMAGGGGGIACGDACEKKYPCY